MTLEPSSGGRYAGAPGAAAPPSGSEATDKGSVATAAAATAAARRQRQWRGRQGRCIEVSKGFPEQAPLFSPLPTSTPTPTPPPPQCQRVPLCSLGWDAFLLVPGLQKRKRRWVQKKRALPRDILQGLRVPIWLEKWSFALS